MYHDGNQICIPTEKYFKTVEPCLCGKKPTWELHTGKVRFVCNTCNLMSRYYSRNIYLKKGWNKRIKKIKE